MGTPKRYWYDPYHLPESSTGYLYYVKLLEPYQKGTRMVRVGGHYALVEVEEDGVLKMKKRLIGGTKVARPHYVTAYFGWTSRDIWERWEDHRRGCGSKLLRHLFKLKWPMQLWAATPGTPQDESALKKRHSNLRLHIGEQWELCAA